MKKSSLLALVMMLVMVLTAQETVTLRFTSTTQNGSYFTFDVVNVTNVTRGWTESLTYPDTTMVLTALTGLNENFNSGGFLSEVYPNPLSGTAKVTFGMKQPGNISAKILSINGSVLSEYNDYLEEGSHQITINMSEPQISFLVVKTNDNQYVKKMLNVGYGEGNSIAINKNVDEINYTKERTIGDFEIGDVMSYIAISFDGNNMIESERITQAQFGDETMALMFSVSTPSVSTVAVTDITISSAVTGGVVSSDGGCTVTSRGVCWSTNQNPTIDNQHTTDGNGTGLFISTLTDLTENTLYYVRAYAINKVGTTYGEQKSFMTLAPEPPIGAINGLFSINDSQRIWFSQGNLQYQASTNTWKFANSQLEYIGNDNSNISPNYNGWIDLFGWGTGNNPTNASSNSFDYDTFIDWGNNTIINGGNEPNLWRTLTNVEWQYILYTRNTTSGIRYAKAQVSGINGIIVLPDNWNSNTYNLTNPNSGDANFDNNTISSNIWISLFEANGAVFLPAAGCRLGTEMNFVGSSGYYHSSTPYSSNPNYYHYSIYFTNDMGYPSYGGNAGGYSVRLVRNIE